jgi:LPXTG-motif cell wall-anchored protein
MVNVAVIPIWYRFDAAISQRGKLTMNFKKIIVASFASAVLTLTMTTGNAFACIDQGQSWYPQQPQYSQKTAPAQNCPMQNSCQIGTSFTYQPQNQCTYKGSQICDWGTAAYGYGDINSQCNQGDYDDYDDYYYYDYDILGDYSGILGQSDAQYSVNVQPNCSTNIVSGVGKAAQNTCPTNHQNSTKSINTVKVPANTTCKTTTPKSVTKTVPSNRVAIKDKAITATVKFKQNAPKAIHTSKATSAVKTPATTQKAVSKSVPKTGVHSSVLFLAIGAVAFGIGAFILKKKEKQF